MDKTPMKAPAASAPPRNKSRDSSDNNAKDKPRSSKTTKNSRIKWSIGKEIAYITFGCIGSLLGIFFFLVSVGFLVGSRYLEGIINDIGATNFTEQMERIDCYNSFFDSLRSNGYKVLRENPEIDQGVIYYLWQATPPGSDESRVFRWKHILESNTVEPLNNSALLLDLKLGFIDEQIAQHWDFKDPSQFYDPDDSLAQAMVNNDFSYVNPADLAMQGSSSALPEGPVGAPVISPEAAKQRQENEEERKAEEQGSEGSDPEDSQPVDTGTPQEPGGGSQEPPADPGGNSGSGNVTEVI